MEENINWPVAIKYSFLKNSNKALPAGANLRVIEA